MSSLPELPRAGRIPENPDGTGDETFVLWPQHIALISKWEAQHKCSRSEAVRMMVEVCSKLGANSQPVKEAAGRLDKLRDRIRTEAMRERSKLDEVRRQRRAESARQSRLRRKRAAGG